MLIMKNPVYSQKYKKKIITRTTFGKSLYAYFSSYASTYPGLSEKNKLIVTYYSKITMCAVSVDH
jgi:hypothetical protein